MNRREAIRRVTLMLGGVVSAPTLAGLLGGCQPGPEPWSPQALTAAQHELVTTIAERIIPATDTPGAREAGVDRFIDAMLADWYPAAARERFLEGLADVEARAAAPFLHLGPDQQTQLLDELDRAAYAELDMQDPPFFRMMKELTLFGYYTSEVGATRELKYQPVPGRYDGDVPYPSDDVNRAWSG